MYIDTQIEASESDPLTPVNTPPASGTSWPSNYQDGTSSLAFNINSLRVNELNDLFSDARDKLEQLNLTSTQQDHTSDSNSERARRLKALPTCKAIKTDGLKGIGSWAKSFELTEQQPLFQDLEPLEALKKNVNRNLIQSQFEVLVEYSAGVKASYEEFQALRKPFDDLASAENMPVDLQVEAVMKLGEELMKNRTALGKNVNTILESHHNIWKFLEGPVKETHDKIESSFRDQYNHQEDIQLTLDMLKDGERLLPKFKEPFGFASAALDSVGKYGFLKIVKKYQNKWQGSKMLQDMYKEEKSKADTLHQELDESVSSIHDARTTLEKLQWQIYTDVFIVVDQVKKSDTQVSYVAMAKKIDVTEGNFLTFMELIEEFLARITEEYGGKFGTREAERLCSRVPNIFTALDMLLSAKEVIVDGHQSAYEGHIYDLCKAISEHFKVMEEMHWECRDVVNMERQTAFLRDDVPRFQKGVAVHLQAIQDIARTQVSVKKRKEAYDKRVKQDRLRGNSSLTRRNRPLVTGEEISWALRKVVDALLLIEVVSGGQTTFDHDAVGNTNRTGVAASNSNHLPWFKMPKGMMDEFHAALLMEAKKLEDLKNKKQEGLNDNRPANAGLNSNEEPEGRFTRLLRLMTRKPR